MNLKWMNGLAVALVAAGAFAAAPANAYIINFTAEGVPHGPSFASQATAGGLDITTPIGTVVFNGGAVLTDASNAPADEGTVYYTSFFCCGTGTTPNTLTITFPQNINNFFVDLYNGETYSDTFTASDNNGESTTVSIAPNLNMGNALISFPAMGDRVTITTTDPSYDFFIDNIGFDQPPPGVPEPTSLALFASALLGLGFFVRHMRTAS